MRKLTQAFLLSLCISGPSPALSQIGNAATTPDGISLPSMGTDTSPHRSAAEAKLRGEWLMRQIRRGLNLFYDPEIDNYIVDLGYRLVSNSDYHNRFFYFFGVNDPSINAFAAPGGYIGVHSGLILAAETEGELAAVMAHEVAHIGQLHIDRATEEANKLSLPTYAALVAAVILGSQNANITEAAILATMAANIQSNLNFTRAHEREADHIGMKILTQSQFDPHAMPAFFERLQQNDRLYDAQVPEFFRTHPVTSNRIAETRDRASKYDYHPLPDKLRFHLIKAKIRVLSSDNPADMVARYEAKLNTGSYTHRYAELYGYSLALLKNHQFEEAGKVIESLIKEDRERIPYLLVKAQIKSSSGQVKESYSVFEDALALYPNNYALSHSYAETLLQFGEPEKAASLLNSMKKNHPTPPLYQLLAKAEGESRHTAKAHQALAEFYFLNGLTHTAIEQLNLALKQRRVSDMDKIRIESRMQEFKEIALAEKNLDLN